MVATVTVPSVMIMNPTPPSPRTTISCPDGCFTVFICFSIDRISDSGKPLNTLACLSSTIGEILCLLFAVEKRLVQPVGFLLPAVDDLRIALQRVQVGVPQDLLDQPDVSACHLEQGRRGRVPSHMGGLERPRAELLPDLFDDVASSGRRQPTCAVVAGGTIEVDEHRQAGILATGEVVLHGTARVSCQIDAALFGALAGDDQAAAR